MSWFGNACIGHRSSELLLLFVVGVALIIGCDRTSSVAGVYVFERSSVVTAVDNETDCGLPGMPSLADDAAFAVRGSKGEAVEVLETVSECVFPAHLDGDIISATDVECDIAPDSAVRRTWGLYQEKYLSFQIDTRRGTLTANTESWQTLQQAPCTVARPRRGG